MTKNKSLKKERTHKKCSECKEDKMLSEFYRDRTQVDGHHGYCKKCSSIARYKNREKTRKHVREWLRENIKKHPEYNQRSRERLIKLGRDKVYSEYQTALKKGIIKKEPCKICKKKYRVNGHHPDYSKPLEVIWLCPIHHKQLHMGRISV